MVADSGHYPPPTRDCPDIDMLCVRLQLRLDAGRPSRQRRIYRACALLRGRQDSNPKPLLQRESPDTRAIQKVPRRVKDFIDISEYTSLDALIRYLETIRDNLPADCEAELKIRGDDVFGRRLTITYFREQSPEEAELEARYSNADEDGAKIEQLRRKLDEVPYKLSKKKRA